MRVGIPRALFYYHYYPMWRTFFDTLKVECVVSPPSHKGMLADGAARVTSETCLPVKIYLGHVAALARNVDYLFVPLIRALAAEEENCSRLRGLPDLVRAVIPDAPPILAPEIDMGGGTRKIAGAVLELGKHFTYNILLIKKALDRALLEQQAYEGQLISGVPMPVALRRFEKGKGQPAIDRVPEAEAPARGPLCVALLGHAYNLYDEYVNHRLLSRLGELGVELLTPEAVSAEVTRRSFEKLHWKKYWTFEHELVGSAAYYLDEKRPDGMIAVITFGCGPDSVMIESLSQLSRDYGVPLLNLVLDEHMGEAGLITRIEAFVDMLERRTMPNAQVARP